jgi:hypothetical protein
MSSTQTFEGSPVAIPMLASGHRSHHARTISWSVVACFTPCSV